jgi:hypothetical protein
LNIVLQEFLDKAIFSGNTPLFDNNTAIGIIKQCKARKIFIWGIDAIIKTNLVTQPCMEHSVDYSNRHNLIDDEFWDDVVNFLKSKSNMNLLFEIVVDNITDEN